MVLEQVLGKTCQIGLRPGFSLKFREAGQAKLVSPKTEVLEQPRLSNNRVVEPRGMLFS
jgi:hypothetical protein